MVWNFSQYDELTALEDENGEKLTYAQLEREGKALCDVIGRRTFVFSMCQNSLGSVVGYTGFLQNKIVPLLLSARLDNDLLGGLIQTYQPNYIWYPVDIEEKVNSLFRGEVVYEKFGYKLIKSCTQCETELYDELALLLTTSGSTGGSKLVRQSYQNVKVNAEQIAEYLKLDRNEKPITTLPMNYTYGLSVINSHLMVGATIYLTDATIMQKNFWNFLKAKECTSISGVPYTYEMLDKLRFCRMDLPYLKTMTQAGGKLSLALHKKFAEFAVEKKKKFIVMYGQCEATARMAYLPAELAIEKQGAMGIAVPGGSFTIIDDMGNVIDSNNVAGELVYEGDNVTLGYAECRDDLGRQDEFGGVLHTGDIAQRDKDGIYYITGRKKRFLKIYGNRVNLDEVERLIKERFRGIQCACSGFDDNMYIFILNEENMGEIRAYVAEKIGLNQVAFKMKVVDAIPQNEAGKTLYGELEKMICSC